MKTVVVFAATAVAAWSIASTASAPIFDKDAHMPQSAHHCRTGKLCGNICIPRGKTCRQPTRRAGYR